MSLKPDNPVYVNNLPLPTLMIELINQGRWKRPDDTKRLELVTKIPESYNLDFLSIKYMRFESENLDHLINDEKASNLYNVASSKKLEKPIVDLSILDVDMSILFAINSFEDSLCFDYRYSLTNPKVVAGLFGIEKSKKWVVVAENFEIFAEKIGL